MEKTRTLTGCLPAPYMAVMLNALDIMNA